MIKPSWSTERVVVGTAVVCDRESERWNKQKNKTKHEMWERYPSGIKIPLCGLGILIQFRNTSDRCKGSLGVIWNMWLNSAVMLFCVFFHFLNYLFRLPRISQITTEPLWLSRWLKETSVGWNGGNNWSWVTGNKAEPRRMLIIFLTFFFFCYHFPKMGWVIFSVWADWKKSLMLSVWA